LPGRTLVSTTNISDHDICNLQSAEKWKSDDSLKYCNNSDWVVLELSILRVKGVQFEKVSDDVIRNLQFILGAF
jgi:hypothetical protein